MTDSNDLARQLDEALGDGYEVERPLGEGGFAIVFLVRDLTLKRKLAVKVISPEVITSHAMLERFRREAETVAQLAHPNIVPIHFIGQKGELLWLAMQYVDGGSIADRLASQGRLSIDDSIRVICEVAKALEHAHRRGVIHRDVKPANVLVDADGERYLVTDFGIARTVDSAALTATGVMLGTPAYLSPEQITGEQIDHRIDIYALGVMAYELFTGTLPFAGASATAAMMKRLGGPPAAVTTLRPEIPVHLAEAITQCLAVDPADRFQSMGEVVQAFGGERDTMTGRAPTSRSAAPRSSRLRSTTAGVLAVLILAGGGWFAASRGEARRASVSGPDRRASVPVTDVDSSMVGIPAGDYIIGSDSGSPSARPRHVEHVGAFRIERTETTVAEYGAFVTATRTAAPWGANRPLGTLPVTGVAWGEAASYCAWRHAGGRLPTEIEWEAAARGREGRAYPYGRPIALTAVANTASARRNEVAPVGSFPRSTSPEGLQDMSGNVWEWTSSPMQVYPGGRALADTLKQYRVIRGGAFDTSDSIATAFTRGYSKVTATTTELPKTGFRCVAPPRGDTK